MTRHLARRVAAASTATALALVALAGNAAATSTQTPVTDLPTCTVGTTGGLQNDVTSADAGTAVVVGGDYVAHAAAAESEGRLVVAGSTTIAAGLLNVGRAGVGSGIVPVGDVVVSGRDVTVAAGSLLDVNHGVDGGGDVRSGGSIQGRIELNGGAAHPGDSTAADVAADHVATLRTVSAELADLTPTGRLGTDGAHPALVGDGTSDPQVFELTADQAADLDAVVLQDVGDGAVVVNVRGSDARLDTVHTAAGTIDSRIDTPATLGDWAPRVLWNVADATALELAGGSQLVGSVLAPHADVEQTTHTNGRLWVGGDLHLGRSGSGLEHHNYPWVGALETTCDPGPAPTPSPTPEPTTTPSTDPSAPVTTPAEPTEGPTDGPTEPAGQDPTPGAEGEDPSTEPQADDSPTTTVDDLGGAGGTDPVVTSSTAPASAAELPRTGSTVGPLLAAVVAFLALGLGLVAWRRRRS
ncbi:hypothetical protein GCM10023216_16290 [Isoptericola chiayiensis]|uniref:Gram-positive cocci surface proteins LPxTG domain-containing protein n=1 Tax=Isoptericola chiayiensis TaxID=579446 RepID=A0ABP8YEW6_9MICO|nr:choice-of-anchor A family protein [Isoptericola chiayiensis]NOV99857.1 choice-of-anchor A domain-containing protein/LPXTG-motif cell wall-anchored protein [Isoptericola chiayiensis]